MKDGCPSGLCNHSWGADVVSCALASPQVILQPTPTPSSLRCFVGLIAVSYALMPAAAPSSLAVLARRAAFPPAKAASVAALSQRASSSSPSPSSSSLPPVPEPVKLPFELAEPKQRKSDDTLVIAHGLL